VPFPVIGYFLTCLYKNYHYTELIFELYDCNSATTNLA